MVSFTIRRAISIASAINCSAISPSSSRKASSMLSASPARRAASASARARPSA